MLKTEEEKLWTECAALGRKLDWMSTRAATIVVQSQEPDNDWQWAKEQKGPLAEALEETRASVHNWSTYVRTSSLAYLQMKQGSTEAAVVFLSGLKDDIVKATAKIEVPLGELVAMHNIMYQVKKPPQKKQKPK